MQEASAQNSRFRVGDLSRERKEGKRDSLNSTAKPFALWRWLWLESCEWRKSGTPEQSRRERRNVNGMLIIVLRCGELDSTNRQLQRQNQSLIKSHTQISLLSPFLIFNYIYICSLALVHSSELDSSKLASFCLIMIMEFAAWVGGSGSNAKAKKSKIIRVKVCREVDSLCLWALAIWIWWWDLLSRTAEKSKANLIAASWCAHQASAGEVSTYNIAHTRLMFKIFLIPIIMRWPVIAWALSLCLGCMCKCDQ